MEGAYVVAPAAERDIEKLWSLIAADNESAARRLVPEIYAAFALLAGMPGLGHTRADLTSHDFLFWPVRQRYLIIYRPVAAGVEILRVLDGRRDVAALL